MKDEFYVENPAHSSLNQIKEEKRQMFWEINGIDKVAKEIDMKKEVLYAYV